VSSFDKLPLGRQRCAVALGALGKRGNPAFSRMCGCLLFDGRNEAVVLCELQSTQLLSDLGEAFAVAILLKESPFHCVP